MDDVPALESEGRENKKRAATSCPRSHDPGLAPYRARMHTQGSRRHVWISSGVPIDVSTSHLDVAATHSPTVDRFDNAADGHSLLVERLRQLRLSYRDGGDWRLRARRGLRAAAAGFAAAVINLKQARDFATAMDMLAKNDRIEAQGLTAWARLLAEGHWQVSEALRAPNCRIWRL